MEKLTEKESIYHDLEYMDVAAILQNINQEDRQVADAVHKSLSQIEAFVKAVVTRMNEGGRLIYIGAGTSGRLGILDASECPPTFGVSADRIIGLIAGGDQAIRTAIEFAEDDTVQAWEDLKNIHINEQDIVLGISASGSTPYVLAAIEQANKKGILTGCLVCNLASPIASEANYPIETITGPEFITGSTRMKAGTAQKMVLNMISTSVMIKLGRIKGNKMVDMKVSNNKLKNRGIMMLMQETGLNYTEAEKLIDKYGNIRKAIELVNTLDD
ncbi:N-acetylmuramic acid 6-phosphate etherase [Parapedobacter tibetensis]|uniref:N-acetylmuramic acid 6-phosphate etherase n=1 Tax=Parapedobacter tibetensis TaxID=2972951 RepID=UPI00214DDF18|nr:N-acetylmuramic acid 6-phosphate etherase [Parapedobacter tibetensis]